MVRMRTLFQILMLAGFASACTQLTPEQELIETSAAALGGSTSLASATSMTIEGEGTMRNFGQDMNPEATTQSFAISDYERRIDLLAGYMRIAQTRTPNFNYFRGPDPMPETFGIAGDVAYTVSPSGEASRSPNATATLRRTDYYHHPVSLLKAALEPGTSLSNARSEGGESSVDIRVGDGTELTLTIDATSGLPLRISSRANHPNLRDVSHHSSFADYEDVSGIQMPRSIVSSIDDHQIVDLRITGQSLDSDIGDLSAPGAASSAPPISGPPPPNVTAEEVADGVWFLAGQSHHSVLIEFADHLMLYEAPNEPRTLAVIAKARELVPDKPLTQMVSSHHHFDHSGGIRAAISEGLTIIAHQGNAAFYEDLAKRSSRIVPDTLENSPASLELDTVDDELVIEDDTMRVELYHIAGNPHADTLLMAYLPRQRLLIEVDAFSPGRDFQPFAANLLDNVRQRGLRVERILPIHGGIVSFDALVDSVGAQ